MTEEGPVVFEVRDGVAHLTLHRPDAANSIDVEMARAVRAAVDELAGSPDVRAVLLTGSGERFCGGGDVKSFAADLDHVRRRNAMRIFPPGAFPSD